MVFPGEEEEYMETGHERAKKKARHNFSFPNLKWGTQRNLRCMKVESEGGGSVDQRLRRRSSPSKDGATRFGVDSRDRRSETGRWRSEEKSGEEGIEELGVRIISDLRTEKESILRKQVLDYDEEEEEEEEEEPRKKETETEREVSPPEAPGVTAEVKPWNLRKRRAAACKAPVAESEANHQNNERGLGVGEERRPRFLSKLSKKEVEDDYMKMMGHRPPRRPKKHHRTVQKQIDLFHPALYFAERITEDIYKVPDEAENGKRL